MADGTSPRVERPNSDPDRPTPTIPRECRDASEDPNRMLSRRSPVSRSESGLVSRDYQPRTGGPELVASWPLGAAPGQREPGGAPWELTDPDSIPIQQNTLTLPYAVPIDHSMAYLSVVGEAHVSDPNTTMTLSIAADHVEGKGYETSVDIGVTEPDHFTSPMIQYAPEIEDYERPGHLYGTYTLAASVDGKAGYLSQGTAVQLWSE